jgi:hypothetical protein
VCVTIQQRFYDAVLQSRQLSLVAFPAIQLNGIHALSFRGGFCVCVDAVAALSILTPICSKRFVRFVETKWMVLANELVHHILGESKLTNMTLVPSPVLAQTAPYHPGISAVPRNGNSSTLTRADYLWCTLSPGITVLRFQVRFVQTYTSCIDQPRIRFVHSVDWPTDIRSV